MGTDAYNMKTFIDRVKRNNYSPKQLLQEDKVKELSMRDLLKRTRILNEVKLNEEISLTNIDQDHHKNNLTNSLKQLEAIPKLNSIKIINGNIFWSGSVNDVIEFVYKVSSDASKSGYEINYDKNLTIEIPNKDEISKVIEDYYSEFFKYFQNFL